MSAPRETDALRDIDLPPSDQPLREDVRRLGALVGEILAEQVGAEFLAEVERIRIAAIRRREQGAPLDELAEHLSGLDLVQAERLVRAFGAYFQAVNLAERVHRIRRRRDYQKAGAAPQPGGLEAVALQLRQAGVGTDRIAALLPRLRIEPVFTAHPTEAMRRVLLDQEREIARRLIEDIDRGLTPLEREHMLERVRMILTAAWQTAVTPPEKPTVRDELDHVGYYLSEVLYRVVPAFFDHFEQALRGAYRRAPPLPPLLGFGSWVGGDMDGNPEVGADTIAHALAAQRVQVLAAYRRDLVKLASLLTQSLGQAEFDPDLLDRLDAYRRLLPAAAGRLNPRHADMPYRNLLGLIGARLHATERGQPQAYSDAEAFERDLALIERSLVRHRGEHAGAHALRRLIRRVECFGFHLAALDLRQESGAHDAALAALLGDPGFGRRAAAARASILRPLIEGVARFAAPGAEAAAPTLAVFAAVAEALPRYGPRAFGPYIVSMSRSAADALAVLALARAAGCVEADGRVPLDVAPLFETVDDLGAAADTLHSLLGDPVYRAHLAARGDRQIVMLGYSDSAKDAGLIASRWALQRAQVELTALARESGVRIEFFHGRGGSISRGGGKTERAVIAAPRGSVEGHLRLTEQGEVIHRKYGLRALALRNLEQMTGAVLRASLLPRPPDPREARWRERVAEIAQVSRARYRSLIHERPDFPAYFRAATPIDVIERLRLGSRPAKRGGGDLHGLRAIPWVFAWSQNRAGLTAWYGAGTGLAHGIAAFGLEAMREMTRDWPFFAGVVDDLEMVLAKSDLDIFERYSQLAGATHERLFPEIAAEFARVYETVLALKAGDALLAGDRRLRLSIRLRNPYVDPLSLLQVDLLARWRAAGRPDDALFHALAATVNGIAAGIQNTG